jgi:hypothetical protein
MDIFAFYSHLIFALRTLCASQLCADPVPSFPFMAREHVIVRRAYVFAMLGLKAPVVRQCPALKLALLSQHPVPLQQCRRSAVDEAHVSR